MQNSEHYAANVPLADISYVLGYACSAFGCKDVCGIVEEAVRRREVWGMFVHVRFTGFHVLLEEDLDRFWKKYGCGMLEFSVVEEIEGGMGFLTKYYFCERSKEIGVVIVLKKEHLRVGRELCRLYKPIEIEKEEEYFVEGEEEEEEKPENMQCFVEGEEEMEEKPESNEEDEISSSKGSSSPSSYSGESEESEPSIPEKKQYTHPHLRLVPVRKQGTPIPLPRLPFPHEIISKKN